MESGKPQKKVNLIQVAKQYLEDSKDLLPEENFNQFKSNLEHASRQTAPDQKIRFVRITLNALLSNVLQSQSPSDIKEEIKRKIYALLERLQPKPQNPRVSHLPTQINIKPSPTPPQQQPAVPPPVTKKTFPTRKKTPPTVSQAFTRVTPAPKQPKKSHEQAYLAPGITQALQHHLNPGQTIYPDAQTSTHTPHSEKTPTQETLPDIYTQLEKLHKDGKSENIKNFINKLNPQQAETWAKLINDKNSYSLFDHSLVDLLFQNNSSLKTDAPKKYPHLLEKHTLGSKDWKIAGGLLEKGFKNLKKIGQGGMASVYLATNVNTEKQVAIKIITSESEQGRDVHKEAKLGAKFQPQDGVVPVYDAGEVGGCPYIVMSYLEGVRDLKQLDENLKEQKKKLPLNTLLVLCLKIVESVTNLHDKEVVHRDIKPENVLTTGVTDKKSKSIPQLLKEMSAYLSDFGIAKGVDEQDEEGKYLGTPSFSPKEQACGEEVGPPADVYALGITLYTVLTGKSPYPPEKPTTSLAVLTHVAELFKDGLSPIAKGTPASKLLEKKKVPEEIIDMLGKMTLPNPEERPKMPEVHKCFEEYIHSLRPEVIEAKRKQEQLKKLKIMLSVGLPAIIMLFLLFASFTSSRPEAHIGYGAQRIAALKALKTAGPESLKTALDQYNALPKAPEGYEPGEGEPRDPELQKELEKVQQALEHAQKASLLMEEAQKLLKREKPDFKAARAKLRKAAETSDSVKREVKKRLEEVDVAECKKCYEEGVRAYRMGEVELAKERFGRVEYLRYIGLEESQKNSISKIRTVLVNWKNAKTTMEKDALKVLQLRSLSAYQNHIQTWQNRGDAESAYRLMYLEQYFLSHHAPIVRQKLNEPGATIASVKQHLRNIRHPEFLAHEAKVHAVQGAIFSLLHSQNTEHIDSLLSFPGMNKDLQAFYVRVILLTQGEIQSSLKSHNQQGAANYFVSLLRLVDDLMKNHSLYGQLVTLTDKVSIDDFVKPILHAEFITAKDNFSRKMKSQLASHIEKEFPHNSLIIGLMRSRLKAR